MIKVGVISYLNSMPFVYGLKSIKMSKSINLFSSYPAEIADQLRERELDIALVPVVVLNDLKDVIIISDYCIGSENTVDTVCLYSHVPIHEIKSISLDYQSRTSVELLKLLLRDYWKISPVLYNSSKESQYNIKDDQASLVIGDRAFDLNGKYAYTYDLAESWKKMTGMPFVFACWVSRINLDSIFQKEFNFALKYGVDNIDNAIFQEQISSANINYKDYLNKKISYDFNEDKKRALAFFLERINL